MTDLTPELEHRLLSTLNEICDIAELDPSGAELIKYTNNAVYRIKAERAIVRIGVGDLGTSRAKHVTKTSRWLTENNAPAVHLLNGLRQPVLVGDYAATIWRELQSSDSSWSGADLAVPLAEFHGMTPPPDFPEWNPFASARHRLAIADGLGADDHRWLSDQWTRIEHEYRSVQSSLTIGLLHGDAYIGNLLRESTGRFVLCDFDGTSRGPIDYDLVVAAVSAIRFGATSDHESLAATYGRDITMQPSWPTLRRIRELVLVTSVIPDLRRRPDIAEVHAHRLATLRSGAASTWQRYR